MATGTKADPSTFIVEEGFRGRHVTRSTTMHHEVLCQSDPHLRIYGLHDIALRGTEGMVLGKAEVVVGAER